ncbi:TPA: helix-turn-helix transcriptional regulator [Vibrio parahaemolyticus]
MARDRIMSLKEVSDSLGRSPRTIWRWWAKDKCFPKPIQINGRCLGGGGEKEILLIGWLRKSGLLKSKVIEAKLFASLFLFALRTST